MTGDASRGTTIFEVLAREHREIEASFATVISLGVTRLDDARLHFMRLADLLLAHLQAEVQVVFPTLLRLDELCDDIAMAVGDHERLRRTIAELRVIRVTPSEWLRAVRRLELDIEHYIEIEECEMFPVARRALTDSEAHDLADAFTAFEHAAEATAGPPP